jgi:ribosomal protein uS17
MVRRRSVASIVAAVALSVATILAVAIPAQAITLEEKLAALQRFSQPNATSYNEWHNAWANQGEWSEYGFDWSTDLCSSSPDQPLGFDFRMACTRHDFGYRNYKAVGQFDPNKSRIDDAFYFDMKQVCAGYSTIPRGTCNSLAWTYYQAVKQFGSIVVSDKSDKTVIVRVDRRVMHPLYKKYITRSKKYAVHDETNRYKTGDMVRIRECRPISKRKCWEVIWEPAAEAAAG